MSESLARRQGMVRPVSDPELQVVVEACRRVAPSQGDYAQTTFRPDFVYQVLDTVLDLQMHNVVVARSMQHYEDHRWDEIRTFDDLQDVLQRFPDDKEGNPQLAQYLWGNNHWTRVQWLRGLVRFLDRV